MNNEPQPDPEPTDEDASADVSDDRTVAGTGTPDDARSWGSPEAEKTDRE